MKKPTILMILDGFGMNVNTFGNAIAQSKTPNLDHYLESYPSTTVLASGLAVGLPHGQMGNSEVGHLNIGAGRIVYQELTRITKSLEDGDLFNNPAFLDAVANVKANGSALHLLGLVSDGGVHSHNTHLYGLLRLAKQHDIQKVYVHAFLDGRDVPPSSALSYIEELEKAIKEIGVGKIATISGRYYAMDRDQRWERVLKAYEAMTLGIGDYADSASEALKLSYAQDIVDEFVKPTVIRNDGIPVANIQQNDSIIFFNFRPDRAREITRVFVDPEFNGFQRSKGFFPVHYVCMTQYDITMPNVHVAYKPQLLDNTLGEYVSRLGYKQLRIAETEKYAHVTFFFNGGVEAPNQGEDRILIPSPKVATYDLQPEMSAFELTDRLIEEMHKDIYDIIIVNYANADMVGHTGSMDATIKAIEAVDTCLGKVLETAIAIDAQVLLTADHGNADEMLDADGNIITAHSTNPVPFILINAGKDYALSQGCLADIVPTMLQLMGIDQPEEMTGKSMLI
ncbi:MAG: 2,3-bisphosphoglycerate-independent phosphoglycerate mutase [Alkaliphilus sp.]|nr:2,3-bisphosphoglycerate-independent phosphoglycerate mutase [Alkaliphilus sp.]